MAEEYLLKRVREKLSSTLDTQGRVDVLREVYDDRIAISTDLIYDSKNIFKATVAVNGQIVATGHGSGPSIAEAEKNAIDTALAALGVHGGATKTSSQNTTGPERYGVTMENASLHAPPLDPLDWRTWGQNLIDDVRQQGTVSSLRKLWNDNISTLERMKEEDPDKYRVVWEKFQEAKHDLNQEAN